MPAPSPVMLVILDGWGARDDQADNAVRLARTPNFDRLWADSPHGLLDASGLDVGLPPGQVGNSEVGHLNIGAGRVVMQELPRIAAAIADGSLAAAPALVDLIATLRRTNGACHLVGLVSTGGVHSHQSHAIALARILAEAGIAVRAHAIMDGRDTVPGAGAQALRDFAAALPAGARITSVSGRYYAMDRDRRWDRVARAYAAMVDAEGPRLADPASVIDDAYGRQITDEFIVPAVVDGLDLAGMRDGDGLLCFNFRADRVRELLAAILDPGFEGFVRQTPPKLAVAVGLTGYGEALAMLMQPIFPPQTMRNLLGQVAAAAGLTQLRMAESEKYPHVTYFLNGGIEAPDPGEDRIVIPSPKVATYDLAPEMSAPELTDRAVAAIAAGGHDLIVLNFANPDMVGHTGVLSAAIRAVEATDAGLGRIADAVAARGGVLLVTADHGNCELMRDPATGGPHTAHTLARVPVLLAGMAEPPARLRDGRLADLAPTLLARLGVAQPAEMTGRDLVQP